MTDNERSAGVVGPLRVPPAPTVPTQGGGGIPAPGPAVDLRLDGNLGSSPGAGLLTALADVGGLLRGYPSGDELERMLAARHGVTADRVVLGAGADELLDRLARAVLAPGRAAVLPVPTFEMLERYALLAGAAVVRVPWTGGAWPREQVLAALTPATALVAMVSPNNPTGLTVTAADLAAVAAAAPQTLIACDAAYAEYADDDPFAAALTLPNAVLLRTFSKAYGLAGLRIGYAIAAPEVARWLRAIGSPFTAGRLARAAAVARLADGPAVAAHVAAVRAGRDELAALLAGLGARPLPSQANFVFARPPAPDLLRDLLGGLGIAVRAFRFADLPELPAGVRITVPDSAADRARLAQALRAALRPRAFVLDLDGVLADLEGRRPLAAVGDLAALAAELPVAVVTSCPRRLCDSVLQRYGFAAHVRTAVCAEDGPGKPDPFPVREALRRLGVDAAWMLGDNVVDVQAARAAGVVPFAVEPVAVAHRAELANAGPARLLRSLPELLALYRENAGRPR